MKTIFVVCIKNNKSFWNTKCNDFLYACKDELTAIRKKAIYLLDHNPTRLKWNDIVIYEEQLYTEEDM